MIESPQSRSQVKVLIAALIIVACLELLWNLPVSRFPVYWLPVYSPLPAIALNASIHILLMILPIVVLGSAFIYLIKKRWVSSVLMAVGAVFYIFYMGCSVWIRLVKLIAIDHKIYHYLYPLVGLGLIGLTAGGWWMITYRGRHSGYSLAWSSTIVMSSVISVIALALQWPLSHFRGLFLLCPALVAIHCGLWFITRHWYPSWLRLAKILLIITVGALAVLVVRVRGGGTQTRPNLVLLVWDTTRADHMSLYGYTRPTTPSVESLAEHGIVFTNAQSTSNYTFPSHVSIFTGLYCREHGLWEASVSELNEYPKFETLAEALRQRGYRTLMITENLWVSLLNKGFQFYFEVDTRGHPIKCPSPINPHLQATPMKMPSFPDNCLSPFLMRQLADHIRYLGEGFYKYTIDRYLLRALKEQLILKRRNQPVFFFMNWMNVHNRYHPYRPRPIGKTVSPYPMSEEYDYAIQYADIRLKEVMDVFRRAGEFSRTVFILTSDHGEFIGEYDIYGHRKTMFETVLRVPLLISHITWSPARIIRTPVTLNSLKTALEFLADTDSLDASAIEELTGIFLNHRGVVAEHRSLRPDRDGRHCFCFTYLAGDGTKLIHDPDLKAQGTTWGETVDLIFDLSSDPRETRNLYQERPQLRQRLTKQYGEWLAATPQAGTFPVGQEYPPGLQKWLRALGYTD